MLHYSQPEINIRQTMQISSFVYKFCIIVNRVHHHSMSLLIKPVVYEAACWNKVFACYPRHVNDCMSDVVGADGIVLCF